MLSKRQPRQLKLADVLNNSQLPALSNRNTSANTSPRFINRSNAQSPANGAMKLLSVERKPNRFAKEKYLLQKISQTHPIKNEIQVFVPYDLSRSPPRKNFTRDFPRLGEQDIEKIFLQRNIDLSKHLSKMTYLPLELFEDQNYNQKSNEELAEEIQEERNIRAQILVAENGEDYHYYPGSILDYSFARDLFRYRLNNGQTGECYRINFICHHENPNQYVKKVKTALKSRIHMDSLLRYNYYIDNMKTDDVNTLEDWQLLKIRKLLNSKFSIESIAILFDQVKSSYMRCQNKILFDTYLRKQNDPIFSKDLKLPKQLKPPIPQRGKLELEQERGAKMRIINDDGMIEVFEPRPFSELQRDFAKLSLYSYKEVIRALVRIKTMCQEVLKLELFYFNDKHYIRVDEFRQLQDHTIHRAINHIRNVWLVEIIEIIKHELKFHDRHSPIIDGDKVDRFFQVVRIIMQDTLSTLIRKNFLYLQAYLAAYIPDDVIIKGTNQVQNVYLATSLFQTTAHNSGSQTNLLNPTKKYQHYSFLQAPTEERIECDKRLKPLYIIDINHTPNEEDFCYSFSIKTLVAIILGDFDRVLKELEQIPDPEPRVLDNYYKFQNQSNLRTPSRPLLQPPPPDPTARGEARFAHENQWLWDLHEVMKEMLDRIADPMQQYLNEYAQLRGLLRQSVQSMVKQCSIEDVVDFNQYALLIEDQMRIEKDIANLLPPIQVVSIFEVRIYSLTSSLIKKQRKLISEMIEYMALRSRELTNNLLNEFASLHNRIRQNPSDIEELTKLRDFVNNGVPVWLDQKMSEITRCIDIYDILERFQYRLRSDDTVKRWTLFGLPQQTKDIVLQVIVQLDNNKASLLAEMSVEQTAFKRRLDQMEREIGNFHQHTKMDEYKSIARRCAQINEMLQESQEEARRFNQKELLFEREPSDYSKIQLVAKEFQPYLHLWSITDRWFSQNESWHTTLWAELDSVSVERFIEESHRNLQQVVKFMKEREVHMIMRVADRVKAAIEEFRPKVPLMVALKREGMRDRHWDIISQGVGYRVHPKDRDGFCFQMALDMGLMQHVELCVQVGEQAQKEYQIETILKGMQAVWQGMQLSVLPFKKVSYILKKVDEIQQTLDEHLLQTQGMQFSPFKKPFEHEIIDWCNQLKLMSDILEEWIKVQMSWMYLYPIFDSQDITKQLPLESRRFRNVDKFWCSLMLQCHNNPAVLKVMLIEDLLEHLRDANTKLESIVKELDNYLEKKREHFARFYFLSNDDLLEILSQTKEPTAVQPHLKKVFENIKEVEFNDGKRIVAMQSAEGEKIVFPAPVNPNEKNVEDWMQDLEDAMKLAVKKELTTAVKAYTQLQRTQWVRQHPAQVVLNGSQVIWTEEIEQCFRQHGTKGIRQYWEVLDSQLSDLVDLVRAKLTKMQLTTVNALIVIDVHAKDVVEMLWKSDAATPNSFEWISQLRYYRKSEEFIVRCLQTEFPYGYEYLGNTLRLVITPLTDKCYMTLMGAIQLNLGGAPAGPAGTGKTETTKDLAKALAKQCVVFNCSDAMDHLMLAQFFKGLAGAGAWCCFDEFNRIYVEVLSVIAQQLLTLFTEKAKQSTMCEFEGSTIRMSPYFSVFITMNPGYAGRTELPDNLKALFRPVAMMVPDYAMIGEIMLFSFGFRKGRDLAKKMVATFKLCSEQLSAQDHYDYGMRAVRSVINAAGLLKAQQQDDDSEEQLLLRALRDVNVPKFLKDDLPLFESIIKDLFPGINRPTVERGALVSSIKLQCEKFKLQPALITIEKTLQLFDTLQVRHGLMLVGPAGGGKTSSYRILASCLSSMAEYYKVSCYSINPKSIEMGQLYGQYNEQTHEWSDGVLASLTRELVKDESVVRHWVVFDGPVDSLWIESMNTVLDDNKKLCLSSGQILTLTPYITMIFEVEDLAVASPATVSRCGMVYLEPSALTTKPYIKSWLARLPRNLLIKKTLIAQLENLFEMYMTSVFEFLHLKSTQILAASDLNIVQSTCRMLQAAFLDYSESDFRRPTPEEVEELENAIDGVFLQALTWSAGATLDGESRKLFDLQIREMVKFYNTQTHMHESLTIFEVYLLIKENQFVPFQSLFSDWKVADRLQFHEIMIPTIESVRIQHIVTQLIGCGFPILFPGPTGCGKTLNALNVFSNLSGAFQYVTITFSAKTTANQTQDQIDQKLEKRRKGYYGPPIGKKCIVFVDDFNMPKKEIFGAQPPLELVRQFFDHSGWYSRKDLSFMRLEDVIFVSAMTSGSGRQPVSERTLRHFTYHSYTEMDSSTMDRIFTKLCQHGLQRFNEKVRNLVPTLVSSVIKVHNVTRETLLPTPLRPHYTFNLRDVWKVFQGICSASHRYIVSEQHLGRLWYHELVRGYQDRMVSDEDKKQFNEFIAAEAIKFNLEETPRIVFCDFVEGDRQYAICDTRLLIAKLEVIQDTYNRENVQARLNLVLFANACEQIAIIARILRQPQGNPFLMGVGGSGRRSLARLANYIQGYELFQVELTKNYGMKSWRDDLKKLLMWCGVEEKPHSFLFSDSQITNETMLENINQLINSGDVTGIYGEPEMQQIMEACKNECTKRNIVPNKMNVYQQYLNRIKQNIHMILCMSPLNSGFAQRLRMFPALTNCSTMTYLQPWPEEALTAVASQTIKEYSESVDRYYNDLVTIFRFIHQSMEGLTTKFKSIDDRCNHVTPQHYLNVLQTYHRVLSFKRTQVSRQIERFQNGLNKLLSANTAVDEMSVSLAQMQPDLEKASIETERVMERLAMDKEQADFAQRQVAKDEAVAAIQQAQATELATKAEQAVADANISLEATLLEVQKLKKDHIVEIKSLGAPPKAVRVVLGGVVILNQEIIRRNGGEILVKNAEGQGGTIKKEEDYFETAKKYLLNDSKELLDMLRNYDKDSIPSYLIQKLEQRIISDPDFTLDRAKQCSHAVKFLFSWVKAMYDYNKVYLETRPLRQQLEMTQRDLQEKTEFLREKKAQLFEINKKIEQLEAVYNEKIEMREDLKNRILDCQIKIQRAQKLTLGLSDEQKRWSQEIALLNARAVLVPGDSVVAAAMIVYSGPFTSAYRQEMQAGWREIILATDLPISKDVSLRQTLGVPIRIQDWQMLGLPKDEQSIENAIILDQSVKVPLIIDPQSQGVNFLKSLGKKHAEGLDILKSTDANIMRVIEIAIQLGKWVLVESIQQLDPSFDAMLNPTFIVNPGGSKGMALGDKVIEYNDQFKLMLATKVGNPTYPPETFVKTTIINFSITQEGLEEQMLSRLVSLENPSLEVRKVEIITKNADDQLKLFQIEDSILNSLSASSSSISDLLRDETLINELQNSKKFFQEINRRMDESRITEKHLDLTREQYRDVALFASTCYFTILSLSSIEYMYQWSMDWFGNLVDLATNQAEKHQVVKDRVRAVRQRIMELVYDRVCRTLYEKHKLLLSLILLTAVMRSNSTLDDKEWRFFLTGPLVQVNVPMNPCVWISDSAWPEVYLNVFGLSQIDIFVELVRHVIGNTSDFRGVYFQEQKDKFWLPSPWSEHCSMFQKMLIIRCFRPDLTLSLIDQLVRDQLGPTFVSPPTLSIAECYTESSSTSPLVFILSPGSDPISEFLLFTQQGYSRKVESISLGQGQGIKAEKMIKGAIVSGNWILLQNCHLAITWMPELEKIVSDLDESVHNDFRLWLTSMPSQRFPASILQRSIKMTIEPPSGIRNNMLRNYLQLDPHELDTTASYRKILFGLSLFHAVIQDRRKFGPIGWNIPYEFTNEDLQVCRRQIKSLIATDQIPFKVIQFVCAELNYGGRVTDDKDLRLIKCIFDSFVNTASLQDNYAFSPSKTYRQIPAGDQNAYLEYIRQLPYNPAPEIFGLPSNAAIILGQKQARDLQSDLNASSATETKWSMALADEILAKLERSVPERLSAEAVFAKYPTNYEESMNTVLYQEIVRYNRLTDRIRDCIDELKKAVKGLIVMTDELETMLRALLNNQVPQAWESYSFLSLKPLGSWVQDLFERVQFFYRWFETGTPKSYWLSGFFFPQAFLTGILQNFSRKYLIPIDKVGFDFSLIDKVHYTDLTMGPDEGCYIHGLFLEGARWDEGLSLLNHARPMELFCDLPLIHLKPAERSLLDKPQKQTDVTYSCPLYKVVSRVGTLSTTGHSTNFVMDIQIPTKISENDWIRAGVAAFLSLRY